jgi:hypothetical protein
MLLVGVFSIVLRGEATTDVSWLITVCERMLNGERAYVDILETNPPTSILLYMPAVVVAKFIGGTPETLTFAFAYASAFGSLWLTACIFPRSTGGDSTVWSVLVPAAVVLFLLPRDVFAQREYFVAAWALPMTATFIRHADTQCWPSMTHRILAAILGGLMIAVKPPLFALPGVLVGLYYCARTRSLSFLLPSGLAAAATIGLVVTAASLVAFPDYLRNMSAIMTDVYVPIRADTLSFLVDPRCVGVMLCLAMTLRFSFRRGTPTAAAAISLIVAAGFLVAYVVQGKRFYYQIYPATLFGMVALCVVTFQQLRRSTRASFLLRTGAAGIHGIAISGVAVLFVILSSDRRPVMHDLTWMRALTHPRALAVSPDLGTSFPLAREIGAIWVGSTHSQWIAEYTHFALGFQALTPDKKWQYLGYHRSDLDGILHEIRDQRPEIIFEDVRPKNAWLVSELDALQPGFLNDYETLAEEGPIRVLRRREGPARPDVAGRDISTASLHRSNSDSSPR